MPTYKNNSTGALTPPGSETIQPDGTYSPLKYIVPGVTGLDLIGHGPAPWTTLHDGVLPATLNGMAEYGQIVIVNDSGGTISVIANEDTSNIRKIQATREVLITQDREIDKLEISGSGGGSIYVYGLV